MVASKVYKYAGTLDLVCTVDSQILNSFDKGKRTSKTTRLLIDFKTNKGSIYFENKLQVRAYDQAYTETSGETVDECWILRLGSQHKTGYEFKQVDEVKIQDFKNVYNTYLTINGGKIEEPPIVDVYPETLQFELY